MPINFLLAKLLSSLNLDLYQNMIDRLIAARRDAGLKQVGLGRLIGQRQTFVSKFETGDRGLDAAEFVRIGRAIGIDPYALMRKPKNRASNHSHCVIRAFKCLAIFPLLACANSARLDGFEPTTFECET